MSGSLADKLGIPVNRLVDDNLNACVDEVNHAIRTNGSGVIQPVSGGVTANITQVGGNSIATGVGPSGVGGMRVTTSTDSTIIQIPTTKAIYSGGTFGWVIPSLCQDAIILQGSATKVVRVLGFRMYMKMTTATSEIFALIKRNTANVGGTLVNVASILPWDSNSPSPTAKVGIYTANPTTFGNSAGTIEPIQIRVPTGTDLSSNTSFPWTTDFSWGVFLLDLF